MAGNYLSVKYEN